jgi:hypothetical protein
MPRSHATRRPLLRRYWLESDNWKEAAFDCFVGEVRCGGTNMHLEAFFLNLKNAMGASRAQLKRTLRAGRLHVRKCRRCHPRAPRAQDLR